MARTDFGKINKYDAYLKVCKIIDSCKTSRQLLVACGRYDELHYSLYHDSVLADAIISCYLRKAREL